MAFFDEVKERFNKTTSAVSAKTKESIELSRLGGEVRSTEEAIRRLHQQIGAALCEANGEVTDEIRAMIEDDKQKEAHKDELEMRILKIRNMHRCPACGAVMKEEANYCSSCGMKMPVIEFEPEEEKPESPEIEYCPDCGAMRKNTDRYCEICGHDYEAAPEEEAQETEETDAE